MRWAMFRAIPVILSVAKDLRFFAALRMTMVLLLLSVPAAAADELTDDQILKAADRARGNLAGGSWQVDLETGEKGERVRFAVKQRHNDFFAEYLEPPKQKGDRLLMVGGNMWFHKPGLSKPVPISQRQKLSGNAAYGDISSTNYAEDYDLQRLPDEERSGVTCYVYDLKAKRGRLTTYDKIKVWIAKDRLVSVRGEYFTVSGKLFKSVELKHEAKVQVDGQSLPFVSEARFVDELLSGEVTVMRIHGAKAQAVDAAMFDVGFLSQ
jgi:hypothetical protein